MQKLSSWHKYIIIAAVVLAMVGTGIFYLKPKSTLRPEADQPMAETPKVELTTWNDPAGFSFQYPKGLSVNNHEEDNENYAHVELTSKDHPGKIIVWASDLPAGKAGAPKKWPPEGGTTLDTMLGGQAAKKILTTAPVKMLTVGTISEGLLFSVEATLTDSDYWIGVHDTITNSFIFVEDTSAPAGQASSADSFDEEEVVQ